MKSISDCLPKHIAYKLGKQKTLESYLLACLPEPYRPFCTLTVKEGQVTLHTLMAPHLMMIRQHTEKLEQCLKAHFPHLSEHPIHFRVSPRQDKI